MFVGEFQGCAIDFNISLHMFLMQVDIFFLFVIFSHPQEQMK